MQTETPNARQRYMDGEISHDEYYRLILDHLNPKSVIHALPRDTEGNTRTPEQWRDLIAADEHLNNVPLERWDQRHDWIVALVKQRGGTAALEPIIGPGGWSLGDSVCTLKQAAKVYAEGISA